MRDEGGALSFRVSKGSLILVEPLGSTLLARNLHEILEALVFVDPFEARVMHFLDLAFDHVDPELQIVLHELLHDDMRRPVGLAAKIVVDVPMTLAAAHSSAQEDRIQSRYQDVTGGKE